MNGQTHPFAEAFLRRERIVAGLMSGTSLDGIDVAVARIRGSGPSVEIEQLGAAASPYPAALRDLLLQNSAPESSSVLEISQLNVRLAYAYADAVRLALESAGLDVGSLDLVGSHGQTIHHVPDVTDCAGRPTTSTLQIGDPSVLANLLRVPVVGDFRLADMALGGQGAPLVPYFDYVVFGDPGESRLLLNLGGIGNLTWLPAGGRPEDVLAFDTGPGNMIIDALASRLLDRPFDAGGSMALSGAPHAGTLEALMQDAFIRRLPPKSTGRERYGTPFVDDLLERLDGHPVEDILATAAAFTVESVTDAYRRFVTPRGKPVVLIVSGGGKHNEAIMKGLERRFAPIRVSTADSFGIDSDLKEALCFALLAHETMNGRATNVPTATGASAATVLGKICLPLPHRSTNR